MSINKVMITGNLTRDPELRATSSGAQVLHIGVAVNDRRRNQQTGEWEEYPNYVDCVTFGNRATALANILHKGSKVAIEGKLRWSQWETNDGQKRSKLEVIIDNLEFMSPRQSQGSDGGYGGSYNGNYGGGNNYGNGASYGGGYGNGGYADANQHRPDGSAAPAASQMPQAGGAAYEDDDIPF